MIAIKIIGANCSKCKKVHEKIHLLVKEYDIPASISYSTDTTVLFEYNIISIPAVIINNKVEFKGIIPTKHQLINALNQYLPEQQRIIIPKSNHSLKYLFYLIFLALIIFSLRAILVQDNDEDFCNEVVETKIVKSEINSSSIVDSISFLYDYSINESFEMTFLEFGAISCRACKMMESVMDDIKTDFNGEVNVAFYNVITDNGKLYAENFKIQTIPVQILLNKQGREVFRHTGYLSTEELTKQIYKNGINK